MEPRLFETFRKELCAALAALNKRHYKAQLAVVMRYAKELADCTDDQLRFLRKDTACLVSWDILMKAKLYGKGKMKEHLVNNQGITADTFKRLPKEDQQRLNTPSSEILLKSRGRIIRKAVSTLADYELRRIVLNKRPDLGILPPDEQGKTIPFIPKYMRPCGPIQMDFQDLILTIRYEEGRHIHKCRINQEWLLSELARLNVRNGVLTIQDAAK